MTKFRVTYDTVTPESAEQGEVADSGYYSRGGWKHNDPSEWTLHDIVHVFGSQLESSGKSFLTLDADVDYRVGSNTYYTIHPPAAITSASYARLKRLLSK